MVQDYHDLLDALVRSGARFLVVGAHALGVHGVPRATVDLDVWVEPEPANAERVWAALATFGAPLEDLEIRQADFTRPNIVAQFGLPPYRIDLLTGISGVTFEAAWEERIHDVVEGVRVPILGRESFILNKRSSGRKKDLADLEALGVE